MLPALSTQQSVGRAGIIYRVCGRPGQNDRPPLPPGHPVSWSLLTDGTVLEGEPYPYPVFDLNDS